MADAGAVASILVGLATLAGGNHPGTAHVTATSERLVVSPAAIPLGQTVFVLENRSRRQQTFSVGRLRRSVPAGHEVRVRTRLGSRGPLTIVSRSGGRPTRRTAVLIVYAPCTRPHETTVQVRLDHDRSGITLSRTSIPCGSVVFVVTNAGTMVDSFQVSFDGYPRAAASTPELQPGQRARVAVVFHATGTAYYQSGVYPPGEPEFGGTDEDGGRVTVEAAP
jgi:hypothetical protein